MMIGLIMVIDLPRLILNLTWISLVVLVLIILYRLLLKRMKASLIDNTQFLVLHSVEKSPAYGAIQFYFQAEQAGNAVFRLYDKAESMEIILLDGPYKKGNTIIDFDSTQIPNGVYYYELLTENQKTSKLMEVKNA
jgi:hypothetical protein